MIPSAAVLAVADEKVSAGPLGFLVLVLIGVATVLLIRNMNARLKRMPRSFDPPPADPDSEVPPPGER
jgi:hypothetical protein